MARTICATCCVALLAALAGCGIDSGANGGRDSGAVNDDAGGGSNDAGVVDDAGEELPDADVEFVARRKYPGPCTELVIMPPNTNFLIYQYQTFFTYDDERLVEALYDPLIPDVPSDRTTFRYDEEGREIEERWDQGDDDSIDIVKHKTYDESGRLSSLQQVSYWPFESGTEEVFGYIHRYEYDEAGNLLNEATLDPEDETVVSVFAYTNGPHGPVRMRQESATGAWTTQWVWTYDAEGLQRTEETQDQQGDIGIRKVFFYNSKGERTVIITDNHTASELSGRTSYSYDRYGNLLVIEYDTEFDGRLEQRNTYTYDCWADD